MKERIFPLIFHKNCDNFFYDNCSFDMENSKASTGRITVRNEFGILHSFTLETSVCGPHRGNLKEHHFTIPALKQLGEEFCKALYDHSLDAFKYDNAIRELN